MTPPLLFFGQLFDQRMGMWKEKKKKFKASFSWQATGNKTLRYIYTLGNTYVYI